MKIIGKYILLFGAFSSGFSYAGMMNTCQGEAVVSSCDASLWQFGGHALYAQATSTAFQLQAYESRGQQQTGFELGTDLTWDWGFTLEASYQYDAANELALSWYHFRTEAENQLASPIDFTNWIVGNPLSMASSVYDTFALENAETLVKPAWDQVNVEFAKTLLLGAHDQLRLHGGVNYSHVAYTGKSYLEGALQIKNEPQMSFNQLHGVSDSYNGFGLRTGLKALHDFRNHFSVYADAAVSILTGTQKSAKQLYESLDANSYDGFYGTSQMRIVPEFDGRVGAQYQYHLAQGMLNADISWLWVNYFNALSQDANDFGIQGLYFGLKWAGDFF